MNKIVLLFLIPLFFINDSYAQQDINKHFNLLENEISSPINYIKQPFDVLHYNATIDLTKAPNRDAKGVCEITIYWLDKSENNKFFFHLRGLKVDSTFYEDIKVTAQPIEIPSSAIYHYEILPPTPIEKDTVKIKIFYSGRMTAEPVTNYNPWGGVHSYSDLLFAIGVGMHNNYVSTTQHWLPCYDHPSDKATFDFKFIVKAGRKVASNGNVKVHFLDNGTDIYQYYSDIPCATNLMTFAVADFIEENYTYQQIPVQLFYLPKDSIYTKYSLAKLNQMIQLFQDKFGPYPFEKVGYVVTPVGSMEHQTMISLDANVVRSYYQNKDTLCATVAHELSHQWFGDLVTPYDFRDTWLNESFATYCENLWIEKNKDYLAYLDYLSDQIKVYFKDIIPYEGTLPLYYYQKLSPSSNYPWTIYNKGSAVVALLRYHLGDSLFFKSIGEYLRKYAYNNVSTDDLINTINSVSNDNYSWFFEQWVFNPEYPIIKVYYYNNSDFEKPFIRILQTGKRIFKNLPVELTFINNKGEKTNRLFSTSSQDTIFDDDIPNSDDIIVNNGETIRTLMKVEDVVITHCEEQSKINNSDIHIFFDPNSNIITINFKTIPNRASYQIFDMLGRSIIENISQPLLNCSSFEVDCSFLSSGIYFFRIIFDNKSIVKPIFIHSN